MFWFLGGIILLIVGYFTYGRFVERILEPDDRETPAKKFYDGVDFVVIPNWKNMLIQLLNIAGVGPVIGVILGIKFGAVVFLIIPVGNIIGGAVHDFVSGMMSIRHGGANLPKLIRITLGKPYYAFFSVFMCFLLLLVVAVFINVPATIFNILTPGHEFFWLAVAVIFLYYICATMFPVDKIIGMIYPFFGAMLMIGSFALFLMLLKAGAADPGLFQESAAFKAGMFKEPIIPLLFVTIACGILSGFHATQSPIIARTMETERHGRRNFYGMMIVEGIIAMIWAAGGLAIYNMFPELMAKSPNLALEFITKTFLGKGMGGITLIAVIILAITSGDTAMRSLRLSLAEIFKIDQKPFKKRLGICIPLIVIVALLLWWSNSSAKSFNNLWNYFAWGNQVLAASTLLGATVWLVMQKKPAWVTLLPGMFMTFIVTTFILWTSPRHSAILPYGVGMDLPVAYACGGIITVILAAWVMRRGTAMQSIKVEDL